MSNADHSGQRDAPHAASLFAALGDSTRLQLLHRLGTEGASSIARLSEASTLSRQAVTKHLKVLAEAGYIKGARRGREHIWQLRPQRMHEARAYLERVSREWDHALGRLKKLVER